MSFTRLETRQGFATCTLILCLTIGNSATSPQQKKPVVSQTSAPLRASNRVGVQARGTPGSLASINSKADFDLLARIYYRGRLSALPHVMFVIDRRSNERVYYVNSRAYKFHRDFVNATYLSLERGRAFYDNNFLKPDRRFILGTIAYQAAADKFTFEFWEGDQIT